MSNRGGARDGAGRPKGEETVMMRVPKGCADQVRALIWIYKNPPVLCSCGKSALPDMNVCTECVSGGK